MNWITPLAELTLADTERVGGKAAHLGAMMRAGFPVPPGFVIDVNAFISHFGEVTDPLVRPSPPLLQAELMAQIVEALMMFLGDASELAVRSSSTDEDGAQASFAGQHSTYYFVSPSHIDQAVLDCWMSLWSNAALSYRRDGWADVASGQPVRMAVIVQKMLPATRSGVTFSRDPVDPGSNDVVIEATWGLGAALVDGRVTPDHIRVDEHGRLQSYSISDKQHQVHPNAHNSDGTRLQQISEARRRAQVLSDAEAEHVANIAQQLETLFDGPQDVEWAYVDDQLYLLQSRPITSRPEIPDVDRQLVVFKPLLENFTQPLTPMSEDLYAQAVPGMGAFFGGWMYLDFDQLRRLNPFAIDDEALVELALLKKVPEALPVKPLKMLGMAGLLGIGFLLDGANWLRSARVTPEAMARFRKLVRKVSSDPNFGPRQTLMRLMWGRGFFDPISHRMIYVNISSGRYFLLIGLLHAWVRRVAPDFPLQRLSNVYHGRADLQSMHLIHAMENLSEQLRESLATDDEAGREIARVIGGDAAALPPHHPFTEAFDAFLRDFGHRGPREMELAAPTWRETPVALLQMLDTDQQPHRAAQVHGGHLAALDELHRAMKPWQRRITDRLIADISRFIALRENSRHHHIMVIDAVRQKLLRWERRLMDERKLPLSGDIFFLRLAEVEALDAGELDPTTAHERIRVRRRQWQRACRQQPPQTINIDHKPDVQLSQDDAPMEGVLQGQSASPGQAQGPVRLISHLGEAGTLRSGEILVAPYTDPAWTPLFSRAAAIVVATGSFLSHAGTVAREMHVPCIVDVSGCMDQLENGQQVSVDADRGIVQVIS